MNTEEIILVVKETKNMLEQNLKHHSETYFLSFKTDLERILQNKPWFAYAKRIGRTISKFSSNSIEIDSFVWLYDDTTYEDEGFIPIDEYCDLIYGTFVKEELEVFLNSLKDYGFKIFLDNEKKLVPFIEID